MLKSLLLVACISSLSAGATITLDGPWACNVTGISCKDTINLCSGGLPHYCTRCSFSLNQFECIGPDEALCENHSYVGQCGVLQTTSCSGTSCDSLWVDSDTYCDRWLCSGG